MVVANDSGTVSDVYMKFGVPSHVESFTSASVVINLTKDAGIGVLMAFAGTPATWDETNLSPANAPFAAGILSRPLCRPGEQSVPSG